MTASSPARRWLVGGVIAASIPYFLLGLELLQTGILFLFSPHSLRDQGFRQDASLTSSIAGLLFFGGVGAALVWSGWRMARLRRRGLDIARGMAIAMALLHARRVFGGSDHSYFDWAGLASTIAIAGYLSVPAVRALFHNPDVSNSSPFE